MVEGKCLRTAWGFITDHVGNRGTVCWNGRGTHSDTDGNRYCMYRDGSCLIFQERKIEFTFQVMNEAHPSYKELGWQHG